MPALTVPGSLAVIMSATDPSGVVYSTSFHFKAPGAVNHTNLQDAASAVRDLYTAGTTPLNNFISVALTLDHIEATATDNDPGIDLVVPLGISCTMPGNLSHPTQGPLVLGTALLGGRRFHTRQYQLPPGEGAYTNADGRHFNTLFLNGVTNSMNAWLATSMGTVVVSGVSYKWVATSPITSYTVSAKPFVRSGRLVRN